MQEKDKLKQKTISGLFWQFLQKSSGQVVSFAISVVLARLLLPEEFGVVALAGMFLVWIGVFLDCGFGTALVQKKEIDDLDYSSIFWAQLLFSLCLYFFVFFISPYLGLLFKSESVVPVLRVAGLSMIVSSFSGIQNAILTRRMDFKFYFYITIIGTIISGIIGLCLAFWGYGVWALVAQSLSNTVISTLLLFHFVRWLPKFQFSVVRFKELFSFGWKYMMSSLIGTSFYQLRGYIIGIRYTAADLAFYNRGEGIPQLFTRNIDSTINGVMFPALSKLQNDREGLVRAISRSMKTSSYVLMPILFGLAAVCDKLVIILYTEKWAPCVPFMQILCVTECLGILNTANLQALKGVGRADVLLRLELYKKPVMIAILIATTFISPLAIAAGMCVYGVYALIINAHPNKKYVGYSFVQQLRDVSGNSILAVIMAVFVFMVGRLDMNIYLSLFLQIAIGVFFYIGFSAVFRIESYLYLKESLVSFFYSRLSNKQNK